MSDQLKPCPFCGSHNVIHPLRIGFPVSAECANCHTCGPSKLTANEATEAWNRRASQWQPIETAPRMKYVIIFDPHPEEGSSVEIARCRYGDKWETYDGVLVEEPTHWQPLPEAPKE